MTQEPVVVVAGIIRDGDKALICRRRADGPFPLKWEFPGGKVETGESLADALSRELREELGIRIDGPEEFCRYRYRYETGFEVELCFFLVSRYFGPVQNKVFDEIMWAKLNELGSFDFLAGDRRLIESLTEEDLQAAGKERDQA